MGTDVSLTEVPGIGDVRADTLRRYGYMAAADVADAPLEELSARPELDDRVARCIHESAKNVCGHEDTMAAALAVDLNIDRREVVEAYAQLAPAIIPPGEAKPTLRRLFTDPDERSVLQLDEYSPMFRHSLLEAGFERIDEVVDASLRELAEANYIGRKRADHIQETAEEILEEIQAEQAADLSDETVLQWRYVQVEAPDVVNWSDTADILAHRFYDPDVWQRDPESLEIIQYAKKDESDLEGKFSWELASIYEAAVERSEIDPEYITVMPSHDCGASRSIVYLAKNLASEFEMTYRKLITRVGSGKQQKYLSNRERWKNQDETLVATNVESGESVVVLDDISTSGASFTTATHRLHEKGADSVVCLALGLTKNQRQPVRTIDEPGITITDVADTL